MSTPHIFSLDDIHPVVNKILLKTCNIANFSREFREKSNADKVFCSYNLMKTNGLVPNITKPEKCDKKSELYRRDGNHMFITKMDHNAFKLYNKSIAFAKSGLSLSLAYANRSAVLFRNKLHNECLKDIETALSYDYPENLKEKLFDRREQSLKYLQTLKKSQVEPYFSEIPQITGSPNKIFECASDSIKMKYSEKYSRHIVAKKKIEPGDVISVEKPYTAVLLHDLYQTHCHHCLLVAYNLIPCLECPLAMFCSEVCRNAAWERYHRFECPLLDTFQSIDATKLHKMALRLVICARNEFNKLEEYEADKKPSVYKQESYKEIHNLKTNEELRPVNDIFARSHIAATLLYMLEHTTFFDDETDEEIMKKTSAALLLRFLMIVPCNMHGIVELQGNIQKGNPYEDFQTSSSAYSFLSLLNHSCAPNVFRHAYGTTVVLRAIRPIEIGQQLFDNYGAHHALMDREERRQFLKQQYWFKCECEACIGDWPLYTSFDSIESTSWMGNYVPVVTFKELSLLEVADRVMAEKLRHRLEKNAKILNQFTPRRFLEIIDNEEILKQCYAILGSKHTVF